MNLVIDVGNTLVKTAVFDQNNIVSFKSNDELSVDGINAILDQFPGIKSCIIGTVRKLPAGIKNWLPGHIRLLILDPKTPLPLKHIYRTFETLGADRISAVIAANQLYPGKNLLVIEAGTCITYDFIGADGVYRGGSISPGISLRFAALHNFTDKLPLIEPVKDPILIGNSTESSIRSGVINGLKAELKGIISNYDDNYENLIVILSGGYMDYFDKTLKNNIFAVPNIVLTGLNIILEFNDKN